MSADERVPVFCGYTQADAQAGRTLVSHLGGLERSSRIVLCYPDRVQAGVDYLLTLEAELDRARIILLLSSAEFWADELWLKLFERAMKRREHGACVIPIPLRSARLPESIARLRRLPQRGKPILERRQPARAFNQVTLAIAALLTRPIIIHPQPVAITPSKRWRWLMVVAVALAALLGLGSVQLLGSLPVAAGVPLVSLEGRFTDHPLTLRKLCDKLSGLAAGRVTCALAWRLPPLPGPVKQGDTQRDTPPLKIRIAGELVRVRPSRVLTTELGSLPLRDEDAYLATLAQVLTELAIYLQAGQTDPVRAAQLSLATAAKDPPELVVLALYVRGLRGDSELSSREKQSLRQLSLECAADTSQWWCRLAIATFIRACSDGCEDLPKLVDALMSVGNQKEKWLARTALARHLCTAKPLEAARLLFGLHEEVAALNEPCLELLLVDATGCTLTAVQKLPRSEQQSHLQRDLRNLEQRPLGLLPCVPATTAGPLAQRAAWRAARGELEAAILDFVEAERSQPDDRDLLQRAECHLLLGDTQRVTELLEPWLRDHRDLAVAGGQVTKVRAAFYRWFADDSPLSSESKRQHGEELSALFRDLHDGPAMTAFDSPMQQRVCPSPRSPSCLVYQILSTAKDADAGTLARMRRALGLPSP